MVAPGPQTAEDGRLGFQAGKSGLRHSLANTSILAANRTGAESVHDFQRGILMMNVAPFADSYQSSAAAKSVGDENLKNGQSSLILRLEVSPVLPTRHRLAIPQFHAPVAQLDRATDF